jgi:uncharacterized protein YkwD
MTRGCTVAAALLSLIGAAHADSALIAAINEFRAQPQSCEGSKAEPVGPLVPNAALSRVQFSASDPLQDALKRAGYHAARAQAVVVTGPGNASAAMGLLRNRYCSALLNAEFAEIGVSRSGNTWQLVLARPLLAPDLPEWRDAGQEILRLANEARSSPRSCGGRKFGAAPPLTWNDRLAAAALAHSRDMATHNYLEHEGRQGGLVGDRAAREGYKWRQIAENIATGQGSARQVVAGWLSSPDHCINIMDRAFTEMGAAYYMNPGSRTVIYWTQVLGTTRR